ncbi:DUF3224 domain-containing protein [Phreatobacter stygius]|uniref:DUF3224 domain-containing protein n=1 Tax=Phreatobacter stygius TaxID=1940610 RepID=A0A4D7B3E6_9HYPH|nr:DUF3224 domain-containing protein [Phreatobacter stygius]QCI68034.1 DUF3224 domain-containing protein [Phreatobacter stygius]
MTTAKGTIKHNNWVEKAYHEANGQKSTTVSTDCVLDGDIDAKAPNSFLMQYTDPANVHYAGYLLVDGRLDGKSGGFIIYEVGTWQNGVATSQWQIVKDSGTGGLKGISGTGKYAAEHDKTVRYELEYELA